MELIVLSSYCPFSILITRCRPEHRHAWSRRLFRWHLLPVTYNDRLEAKFPASTKIRDAILVYSAMPFFDLVIAKDKSNRGILGEHTVEPTGVSEPR